MTTEIKNELLGLIQEGLEQYEKKKEADKTVYRRVCGSLKNELEGFDYTRPAQFRNKSGEAVHYIETISCRYKIQTAVSVLLRVAYRADTVAKLPADRETDIRAFILDTLARMEALGELRTGESKN